MGIFYITDRDINHIEEKTTMSKEKLIKILKGYISGEKSFENISEFIDNTNWSNISIDKRSDHYFNIIGILELYITEIQEGFRDIYELKDIILIILKRDENIEKRDRILTEEYYKHITF